LLPQPKTGLSGQLAGKIGYQTAKRSTPLAQSLKHYIEMSFDASMLDSDCLKGVISLRLPV
jgi:hypothetical protein